MGIKLKEMKQIHFIVLMVTLGITSAYSQNKVLINKKNYNLTENKTFLKDYNLMVTFRQFKNSKGVFQFGFALESKRNDSLFISGSMKIMDTEIICSEKHISFSKFVFYISMQSTTVRFAKRKRLDMVF